MTNSPKSNWLVVTGLLLLGALPALPAGFIVSLLMQGEPHDFVRPIYTERPFPIAIHAVAGVVFWLAVPLQFSARVRQNRPRLHRFLGRSAMLAALTLSLSSLWLLVVNPPVAGWIHRATLGVASVGALMAFALALWAVRKRDFVQHRAWAIRGAGFVYSAATIGLVAIPIYLVYGEFPVWMAEVNRLIGLLVNLAFVEWLLRRKSRVQRRSRKNVYIGIQ